jgi:hypothetical protein
MSNSIKVLVSSLIASLAVLSLFTAGAMAEETKAGCGCCKDMKAMPMPMPMPTPKAS